MKRIVFRGLPDIDGCVGCFVEIEAFLVISRTSAYLVASMDDPSDMVRVEVVTPGLEERLDKEVGGWVGGPFSYGDRVLIQGDLMPAVTRRGRPFLEKVRRILLKRDDASFTLCFTGQ